tara:strand:- start:252 stop:728 length:477 start_codon:yes stop_codon:yes gene_type:complete
MANITLKTVQKRIRTATSTTETMRKDVQSALLGLVEHVSVHGDKNVVLTNAPEWIKSSLGINRKAMVDYLVQFAGVSVEGSEFVIDKNKKANFKEAKATEWWTLKVDQPFAGFDLSIELAKLIKKAESAKDKSDNGDDVVKSKIKVDQNTLNKLRKVA